MEYPVSGERIFEEPWLGSSAAMIRFLTDSKKSSTSPFHPPGDHALQAEKDVSNRRNRKISV